MTVHYHKLKKQADLQARKLRKRGFEVQVHPYTGTGPYKWGVYSYRK